ncbi:hypothetical protein [Lacinutrix sp.]|uniref:hypothetical protein n=1 Tax=Lacinutrix sp. TaxID=1937692 RepID=UPI0025BFEB0F|nr:hypothetical protein [Lacinutrix sp.]
MRFLFLFFLLSFSASLSINAQETTDLLLDIDEPWRSERLTFPIRFAPSLDYKGIEEVRFAEGWSSPDSDEFWTYTFLWYLDEDPKVTANIIEDDIEAYFNGLMNLVGKGSDIPDANVVFVKDANTTNTYIGKAKIFDAFFNKDIQELNIKAIVNYCSKTNKHTVLFTFSPKEFDHNIWKTLDTISLAVDCN